jgi:predicted acyl esterase
MLVGGWVDGYSNAVFRMLRDLRSPRLGIVGPWGHKYPNLGVPGPAIGFLGEMCRWWDHWLKGQDNRIMNEPMLRAYIQHWVTPSSSLSHRPGVWVGEKSWPSERTLPSTWYLNRHSLQTVAEEGTPVAVISPQTTGTTGGEWCPYSLGGVGPELPTDQRPDDAFSLVFDATPLDEALEILGAPVLELSLVSDQPAMNLIARLCDVAPDGQVSRVTYGVLNLTHQNDHESPAPLEPGRNYSIRLVLNDAGHRFEVGHRIRIALSTAYWPIVWPAPRSGVILVSPGKSTLTLPVRRPLAQEPSVDFPPPEPALPPRHTVLKPGVVRRTIATDVGSSVQSIEVIRDEGLIRLNDIDVQVGFQKILRYQIHPADPASARAEASYELCHRHGNSWDTKVRTRSAIGCSAEHYFIEADLEAFLGDERIFSRSWTCRLPRDFT